MAINVTSKYQIKGEWKMINPTTAMVTWKDKSTPETEATTATISFSPDGKTGELYRKWDNRRLKVRRLSGP